jgi:hypothetical protein
MLESAVEWHWRFYEPTDCMDRGEDVGVCEIAVVATVARLWRYDADEHGAGVP